MTEFTREDVLETMLQEAVWTIQFLHDCLTLPPADGVPGGFVYAYPEHTVEELAKLREILPPRSMCVHSKAMAGCDSCRTGARSREVMAWWRERQKNPKVLVPYPPADDDMLHGFV